MEKIGWFLAILCSLMAVVLWLGILNGWPIIYWWFDDVLHFLGGVWSAGLFVYFLKKRDLTVIESDYCLKLILGLSFVALIGVLWEFHEFIGDWYAQEPILQEGASDMISDLFLDLIGGFSFFTFQWLLSIKSYFLNR